MTSFNKSILTVLFSVAIGPLAARAQQLPEPKITHTMIDSVVIDTENKMNCEIAVAMSLDRKEIKIIRFDPPAGKYNMTYFVKNPDVFAKYGKSYRVSELVETKNQKVPTIQASFNLDGNNREAILLVHLADGTILKKIVSIGPDFFWDRADRCLK